MIFLAKIKKRLNWIDLVLIIIFIIAGLYIYERIENSLVYQWRWKDLWGYFIKWSPEKQQWFLNTLSLGLLTTLKLSIWSTIFALLFGFLLGIMKNSKIRSVRWLAKSYIEFVRNVPALVFLFLFYFFFSSNIFPYLGLNFLINNISPNQAEVVEFLFIKPSLLENFISGFISLALLESAYIGEIIWAGIRSIHKGQWESAASLGLKRYRVIRHIILPQAVYKVSPALTGQCISLIKDSSILSIISIQELSFSANNVIATSNLRFEAWIAVAIIYFIICFVLYLMSKKLENKVKLL